MAASQFKPISSNRLHPGFRTGSAPQNRHRYHRPSPARPRSLDEVPRSFPDVTHPEIPADPETSTGLAEPRPTPEVWLYLPRFDEPDSEDSDRYPTGVEPSDRRRLRDREPRPGNVSESPDDSD